MQCWLMTKSTVAVMFYVFTYLVILPTLKRLMALRQRLLQLFRYIHLLRTNVKETLLNSIHSWSPNIMLLFLFLLSSQRPVDSMKRVILYTYTHVYININIYVVKGNVTSLKLLTGPKKMSLLPFSVHTRTTIF